MTNDSTTVAVAKVQIRRGRLAYQQTDGHLWEVMSVSDRGVAYVREDGFAGEAGVPVDAIQRWPLVGIETPAGRVMVGERRRGGEGVGDWTVVSVVDSAVVRCSNDTATWRFNAATVARWPLLPPTPPDAEATERKPDEPEHYMLPLDVLTPAESGAYEQAIEDCNIMIMRTLCGPSADPREQGPGIARLPVPRSTVRPDVVACAEWERWALP